MVPTMWDAIDAGEFAPDAVGAWPESEARPSMSVVAPCCGQRRSADDVWDLRGVPGTVVGLTRPGRRHPHDLGWACTECRSTLLRRGPWRESALVRALGGSPDQVRDIRAREMVRERRRQPGVFKWDDAMADARSALPTGTVNLSGTEPPS